MVRTQARYGRWLSPLQISYDSNNLDEREHELGFSVALHAKHVDADDQNQKHGHERCVFVFETLLPVVEGDRGRDDLQGQNTQPLHAVIPTHGEAPGRVDKAGGICGERACDGEQYCHLAQSMHGTVEHDADEGETDEQRGRATRFQSLPRCHEKAGSYHT